MDAIPFIHSCTTWHNTDYWRLVEWTSYYRLCNATFCRFVTVTTPTHCQWLPIQTEENFSLPEMETLQGERTGFYAHSCKGGEKCPTQFHTAEGFLQPSQTPFGWTNQPTSPCPTLSANTEPILENSCFRLCRNQLRNNHLKERPHMWEIALWTEAARYSEEVQV